MEKNIYVSVILPSLNVAAYIRKSLESVLNQTLENIEVICVDAGSTDGTLEILYEYEKIDDRIKIILSDMKSYGYQVNLGMKQAVGQYVAIVDTDDMISRDMYKVLYDIAIEKNADFVKADYSEFIETNNCILIKKVVPIVTDEELYNRILNITEEQQCFQPQITATWSGIYKRKFIEENNILHNETKGASYQDTGFWFQTYAFASRAYFVNQPFYMYRVDNPNSSVCSKDKVFCICDEFDFILKRLQEEKVFSNFQDTFSCIFFQKYKRNMERIDKSYHAEFLQHFSRDFQQLHERGVLRTELWESDKQLEIKEIICNPEKYYAGLLEKRRKFVEQLQKQKQIIIYGAGKVGQELFHEMKKRDHILCFATSEPTNNQVFAGKPIINIAELVKYKKTAAIVIAVKIKGYKEEMTLISQKFGFENIITIPYGVFDF